MSVRAAFSLAGGYFFGPWGAIAGSIIGGIIDPEKIQGSKIGEPRLQTAREGVPIAIVYGKGPVEGTIIEAGPVEIITVEERQGKGGGPVVESERALQTFAILICEGGEEGITGIARVWEDERLVYDVSTPIPSDEDQAGTAGAAEAMTLEEKKAMSAKFLEDTRFYLGTSTQMPDPALEALHGVGLAPAYRRRAYMVRENHDITDVGVRIPQYRFEVIKNGAPVATQFVRPLTFGGLTTPWADNAGDLTDPRRAGVTYQYGFNRGTVSFIVDNWRDTIAEAIADAGAWVDIDGTPVLRGWVNAPPARGVTGVHRDTPFAPWDSGVTPDQTRADIALVYSRRDYTDEYGRDEYISPWLGLGVYTSCSILPSPVWMRDYGKTTSAGGAISYFSSGVVYSYVTANNPPTEGQDDYFGCGSGGSYQGGILQFGDFFIVVRAVPDCGRGFENRIPIPDAEDYYFNLSTRRIEGSSTCETVAGDYLQLQAYEFDDFGEGGVPQSRFIVTAPVGPTMETGDARNNEAFWEAEYALAVARGDMEAGLTYPADYPVEVSSACFCQSDLPAVVGDCVPLWQIQLDLAERVSLSASQLDVSQLTDCVEGFVVNEDVTAADASRFLQIGYFYDLPEWDSKLRAIKRGGAVTFTITEDDLLEEDGIEETTREQGFDLPKRFHVFTMNAEYNYAKKPQTAERYSPDVLSVSESSTNLPIVMSIDETMQVADKIKKIAMSDQDGSLKLRTWFKFLFATPTDIFAFNDHRYRVDEMNIADGSIEIPLARRDRQSAYTSTLTGIPAPDPVDPTPTVAGPTLFAAMNLPQLREKDNTSGMYLAACGVFSSWPGCDVMLSTDGGVSFSNVLSITQASVIGYLTAIATDPAQSPVSEVISVNAFGGTLDSATQAQLDDGANVFAILDEDNVAEIGQFTTATEGDEGQYDLTGVSRGLLETDAVEHAVGSTFVELDHVYFLPIDSDFAGTTLIFKVVTKGTPVDAATEYEVFYEPPEFILDGGGP